MGSFVDSHAHVTSQGFEGQEPHLIEAALQANVRKIVNICTDVKSLEKGLQLAQEFPGFFNTASTTPHDVLQEGESFFPLVRDCAKKGMLRGIGETGLDYHYEHSPRALQKHYLAKYLNLAAEFQLPVVIHCREAFQDFFDILDIEYSSNGKHLPGVLHCFTGTLQEAEEVLKRGWYLSLSGIVTFKKSVDLKQVAEMVPLEQLLIETDSPYLAPQKQRGKVNQPAFVVEVADCIAQIKNIPVDEVAKHTSSNAENLFKL